jgi:hypothetical protein
MHTCLPLKLRMAEKLKATPLIASKNLSSKLIFWQLQPLSLGKHAWHYLQLFSSNNNIMPLSMTSKSPQSCLTSLGSTHNWDKSRWQLMRYLRKKVKASCTTKTKCLRTCPTSLKGTPQMMSFTLSTRVEAMTATTSHHCINVTALIRSSF